MLLVLMNSGFQVPHKQNATKTARLKIDVFDVVMFFMFLTARGRDVE
jgi:hypothetical protein